MNMSKGSRNFIIVYLIVLAVLLFGLFDGTIIANLPTGTIRAVIQNVLWFPGFVLWLVDRSVGRSDLLITVELLLMSVLVALVYTSVIIGFARLVGRLIHHKT